MQETLEKESFTLGEMMIGTIRGHIMLLKGMNH